jgi:hypothetical protein
VGLDGSLRSRVMRLPAHEFTFPALLSPLLPE